MVNFFIFNDLFDFNRFTQAQDAPNPSEHGYPLVSEEFLVQNGVHQNNQQPLGHEHKRQDRLTAIQNEPIYAAPRKIPRAVSNLL